MNRRNFITTISLAIPTLTMGFSLKPNIPEVINADYIWDVIIPKLPKRDYYYLKYVVGNNNSPYILPNSIYKNIQHNCMSFTPSKKFALEYEYKDQKSWLTFLYWTGICWDEPKSEIPTFTFLHFKKKYMDERVNQYVNVIQNYPPDTIKEIHTLLEDWV